MKKFISLLACLSIILSTACSSSDSSTISEHDISEDSFNTASTSIINTTEVNNLVDYLTLDSTWECDWLKFSINSNWEVFDEFGGDSSFVGFSWEENGNKYAITGLFTHDDSRTKLTVSESVDLWEGTKEFGQEEDPDYLKDSFIKDSFVKNGQAFLVISDVDNIRIMFFGDKLYGSLSFKASNSDTLESVVMKMIDSLEFYEI